VVIKVQLEKAEERQGARSLLHNLGARVFLHYLGYILNFNIFRVGKLYKNTY